MSHNTNTLPAIRALLWERWGVMRWVIPGAVVLYGFLASWGRWVTGEWALHEYHELFQGMHYFVLPLTLFIAIVAMASHRSGGRAYSFQVPPYLHRLPVRGRMLAMVHVSAILAGTAVLTAGLLAVDYLVAGQMALLFQRAPALFVVSVLAFAVWAHLWLTLVPSPMVSLAGLPVLAWLSGLVPWMTNTGLALPRFLTPLELVSATAVGVVATVPAVVMNRRGYWQELPVALPSISVAGRKRGPKRLSPFTATLWYEWRSWGRLFLCLSAPLLIQIVWAGYFLGLFIVLWACIALVFGIFMQIREFGLSGARPAAFVLIRPVPTHTLVGHRLAARAVILLAIFTVGFVASWFLYALIPNTDASLVPNSATIMIFTGVGMASLMLTWVALNAGWTIVAFFAAFSVALLFVSRFNTLSMETNMWVALLLLLVVIAVLITLNWRVRAVSWRVLVVCAALCTALPPAAYGTFFAMLNGFFENIRQPLNLDAALLPWALAALSLYAPALWQLYAVHRCRHGSLGWRFGRGR